MYLLTTVIAASFLSGPGAIAHVNDPLSHGVLGDNLLSVDEAIQVANGTLALTSLSLPERARITGTGAVQCIQIDATTTPFISVQSPLTEVLGQGMAVGRVTIQGVAVGPAAIKPVFSGGAQPYVLSLQSHHITVDGFRFENGAIAVDAKMPAMPMPMTEMAMVGNCEFDSQTSSGVRVRGTGTDETMLMVHDSTFTNMPIAFDLDDQTSDGRLMSENERITMDGVTVGCSAFEGGFGNTTMWALWRSTFVNGETLAKSQRSATATSLLMLRIVYSDAICSGHVVDCEGTAGGPTMIHHHHSDWVAGAGKKALWTHPRTAQFDIHGSEMMFDGDIWLSGNTSSQRLWHQNNHYVNSTITFDTDGALPNLLWNNYENCSIEVPALARSPVVIRSSHLINTDLDSLSFLAPISLEGSWRSGGTLTGFSSEHVPAPSAYLGTTDITPKDPQIGTSIQLSTDLPFGIGLIWDVVESYSRPGTSTEPIRLYGDPATAIILPGLFLFQSTLTVPLPNATSLVGLEFYFQGISIPLLSQPHVPIFHLPRGSLVKLTM